MTSKFHRLVWARNTHYLSWIHFRATRPKIRHRSNIHYDPVSGVVNALNRFDPVGDFAPHIVGSPVHTDDDSLVEIDGGWRVRVLILIVYVDVLVPESVPGCTVSETTGLSLVDLNAVAPASPTHRRLTSQTDRPRLERCRNLQRAAPQ